MSWQSICVKVLALYGCYFSFTLLQNMCILMIHLFAYADSLVVVVFAYEFFASCICSLLFLWPLVYKSKIFVSKYMHVMWINGLNNMLDVFWSASTIQFVMVWGWLSIQCLGDRTIKFGLHLLYITGLLFVHQRKFQF